LYAREYRGTVVSVPTELPAEHEITAVWRKNDQVLAGFICPFDFTVISHIQWI